MDGEAVSIGVCRNPKLRLKKPLSACIEQDHDQYVVTWARGDVSSYGCGLSKSEAVEDFADTVAEDFLFLSEHEQLSAHLQLEKSVLQEHFEFR